ncbi:MAG: hypothetical protein FJX68_17090 [Alphaproteobacteria bacterium]|nr:hypothetical protein [Alphaproteobacteria bacterium]
MRAMTLAIVLLPAAVPAFAQTRPATPAPAPAPAITVPAPVAAPKTFLQNATVRQSAAVGVSLFAGAVAGSAFIGGTVGAVIGGAAGILIGNWWYVTHEAEDN